MRRHLLARATILLSLAATALPAAAVSAPTPLYTVTCAVGASTTTSWQRARLLNVTFEWFAAPGSSTTFPDTIVPVSPHPPSGSIKTPTPSSSGITPATLTVVFQRADGTTDQKTATCT